MGALKKVYSRIDELTTSAVKLLVDKIQTYKTSYNLGDFLDDDLINLRAARALSSNTEITIPIDGTTTTYTYNGARQEPFIWFRYTDTMGLSHINNYDAPYNPTTKVIDFSGIPVSDNAVAYVS